MKNLLMLIVCILIAALLCSCTIQFKAKEIELDGHVETTYELERFAWTVPVPEPPGGAN